MNVFSRNNQVVHINLWRTIINTILLYGIFFLGWHSIKSMGTFKRGFFCNDQSIRFRPYPNTLTRVQYRMICITFMNVSFFVIESFHWILGPKKFTNLVYRVGSRSVSSFLVTVFTLIGYSQIGYVANELLVRFVKGATGRLRPYFLVACNPLSIVECEIFNVDVYVMDYQCQGDPKYVEEARKSFYSGQSAVTMYCAFWIVLYMEARLKSVFRKTKMVSIIQVLLMVYGFVTCTTSIADNKHYWSDVIVGAVVGMTLAYCFAVWYGKIFKRTEVGEDLQDVFKPIGNV
ncbi:Protein CBG04527 [Caenorhabditis briggsae]|uniref:Protein CBG04527 n=2 Tax=Caenorhabditis briggsae TaxID=6238 RepID=A8WXN9_CAEBR|nr:Protein CBG04527 [Caenorhabditis briggsae]ULT81206.1 hypothetical protein L3Y34_011234 [Caenorhabditis briggsae]CAP25172.1 Protein CBG04527 [Caenorhabditis briggsae]